MGETYQRLRTKQGRESKRVGGLGQFHHRNGRNAFFLLLRLVWFSSSAAKGKARDREEEEEEERKSKPFETRLSKGSMELFPDNAYFNFGRLRKSKRAGEQKSSTSGSGSQRPASSLDRRLDS